MIALRFLVGLLIIAAIGVALVPLWVLLDLHDGGSGWGLCPDGLTACRNGYFAGFEMLALITISLSVIVVLVALCVRTMRVIHRRQQRGPRPKRLTVG